MCITLGHSSQVDKIWARVEVKARCWGSNLDPLRFLLSTSVLLARHLRQGRLSFVKDECKLLVAKLTRRYDRRRCSQLSSADASPHVSIELMSHVTSDDHMIKRLLLGFECDYFMEQLTSHISSDRPLLQWTNAK